MTMRPIARASTMVLAGLLATAARAENPKATTPARRTLTVEDAVLVALAANPRLAAARDRLRAAHEMSTSTARRMLPAARVHDDLQRYDSPFVVTFPTTPGAAPGDGFRLRNQTINTFVASIDQPLLGLLRLDRERRAGDEANAAVAAEVATMEADLRLAVETYFLRTFEAQAMEKIANTSADELDAEATVARARLAAGVINPADLLRIQVAAANSRQQALQAHSEGEVTRYRLFATLGLEMRRGEGGGVVLVEPNSLLAVAQAPLPATAALLSSAHQGRTELAQRLHLSEAAAWQARARWLSLLPDINFEAAYLRSDGQIFTPKNSAFVGLKADWAVWEWGASEHLRRSAEAQAAGAARDAEAAERQIESEVATSLAEGDAARGAVAAADQAIAGAEEAFRVTQAGVKAGAATTTDLLESQSALTQARLNLTRARYELALARVGLARASGL